jgi:fatty acid amide hydrolase 2
MHELLTVSGLELARRIRAGRVSALEVVEAHITRILARNPALNAVVAERFEAARGEARLADRRLAERGPDGLPPFHGVPCTLKENFSIEGLPWTSGLVSRKGLRVKRDAPAVQRLRAAGAIPLGVTNVSELCMWMEAHNHVYGRTGNPYAPRRIVGGSSGGEGASVGAGFAPFGLGSDIGGSLRMPAFFNGVFTHKATGGLIPNTGQFPLARRGPVLRMLTTGPLCRRAEDLWPLVKLLAGPDGQDEGCREIALGDPDAVRAGALRVFDCRAEALGGAEPTLLEAQERAARALGARGARVERAVLPLVRGQMDALTLWAARLHYEDGTPYKALMAGGPDETPVDARRELLRALLGRSRHTLPSILLGVLEDLAESRPGSRGDRFLRRQLERGREVKAALEAMLGDDGVMLFPSHPRVAPRHNVPLLHPFAWVHTALFNVLEVPVTQVPLGLDRRGLPLGVQVVAGPGRDHLGVAVARFLEADLGGWTPPPA